MVPGGQLQRQHGQRTQACCPLQQEHALSQLATAWHACGVQAQPITGDLAEAASSEPWDGQDAAEQVGGGEVTFGGGRWHACAAGGRGHACAAMRRLRVVQGQRQPACCACCGGRGCHSAVRGKGRSPLLVLCVLRRWRRSSRWMTS